MQRNITAYTETGLPAYGVVGYVSIKEREDGVCVSVRNHGDTTVEIVVPAAEWARMAHQIAVHQREQATV
jgi:hypothetical protein